MNKLDKPEQLKIKLTELESDMAKYLEELGYDA